MMNSNDSQHRRGPRRVFSSYPLLIVFFSLIAIVSTYFLANSALEVGGKTGGFAGIVAAFLIMCVCLYLLQSRQRPEIIADDGVLDAEIDRGLDALDEGGEFFAGSLKPADTFRLVASRVRDLMPFKSMVFYRLDPTRTRLLAAEAEGMGAEAQKDRMIGFDEGLAGQCYSSRHVEIDSYMSLDTTQVFASAVAIPLRHGDEVFAVLQVYFDDDFDLDGVDQSLFEAIGSRVAPMILSSIALERSQANALTDITTDLPNERAFYLILENRLAEALRRRDERPLVILAIDIKNFEDINSRFGHAAGDRVLNFVAQVVKDNLREMDFLARSINDEFLAILPTASKEISQDVIARVHTGFFGRKLKINDDESIEIEVHIGWAAFGSDGETPGQLLSLAQLRKEQSKSIEPPKVLWFPKELVH